MALQPRVSGDNVQDQWAEEVTYELNNVIAQAALTAAQMNVETELVPVYSTNAEGSDQSFTLGSRQFVYYASRDVGTDLTIPLPAGTVFTRFRGNDSNTVEISIRVLPTNMVNRRGETRDWTDFEQLARDWAIGAIDIEEFPEDPDGMDFNYQTDMKILYARVRTPSDSSNPNSGYFDPADSRALDYTWSRNGEAFTPSITDVTTGFPFIFLQSSDVTVNDAGTSAQFFCNIVQL